MLFNNYFTTEMASVVTEGFAPTFGSSEQSGVTFSSEEDTYLRAHNNCKYYLFKTIYIFMFFNCIRLVNTLNVLKII